MQTLHQPAAQGWEPKWGNEERQHKHGDAAYCLPGQQAEDRQQGQAHTSHNAHRPCHAGQERKHRHRARTKGAAMIFKIVRIVHTSYKMFVVCLYMYIITPQEGANKDASAIPTSGQNVQKSR